MQINIGTPVDVQKLLDTRLLIQAGSGGGKSYAVRKTIESVGSRVQQIILDPEGEFISLREKFDFALVAKVGGDIPLSVKYAETLAHKLLETNLSAVIDLYELKHAERILFVKRFLDALINAPKTLWHSCLVYIDEAHVFAPEGGKAESLSSVIDLCTRGRKRGFAAVLATTRLSLLHKAAAAECNNKLIGRTGLDIDRKRSGDELGFTAKQDVLDLRNLEPGEFYTFGPAISREVIKFTVGKVITTHPQSGKRIVSAPPTPAALRTILEKLKDLPEDAEKELITKQQLQEEVTRLRRELNKQPAGDDSGLHKKEIEALKQDVQREREKGLAGLEASQEIINTLKARLGDIAGIVSKPIPFIKLTEPPPPARKVMQLTGKPTYADFKDIKPPVDTRPAKALTSGNGKLPLGELKIMTACAQYPNGVRRKQLTALTGYKKSSRDAYIQRLKQKDCIAFSGDRVIATDEGFDALGPDFEPLPTGRELQQHWLTTLPEGERKILQNLIDAYPNTVARDNLSEDTGYKKSSRDAYIQRLAVKELIEIPTDGIVRAADHLF